MKNILIVAGEASGDTLGAGFVREFVKLRPDSSFFGLGGDKMANAGVKLLYHIDRLAFLGFWEVVKNFSFITGVRRDVLNQVKSKKPEMAVLIDYPGFNLRLAAVLKKRGIKVFYYISPQIWAWGAKRIRKIKKNVDLMTTIFRFETEIYEKAGVPVTWVGHPLLDEIRTSLSSEEFRRKLGLKNDTLPIGLFPGSRVQEINLILPELLSALKLLKKDNDKIQGIIGKAPGIENSIYNNIIGSVKSNALLTENINYDIMAHAAFNIVCSGTATLECAIIGTPLLVVYKTSFLTYHIARRLIRIPFIGMANVVAGKKIVPELVQKDCSAEKIAAATSQFLYNKQYHNLAKEQLSHIKTKLGEPGAARKAAMAAIELLDK